MTAGHQPVLPPATDREVLQNILADHQLLGDRCLCGYEYAWGESIRLHRADVILSSGWFTDVQEQERARRDAAQRVRELCVRVVRDEFFGHTELARVPVVDVLRALGGGD